MFRTSNFSSSGGGLYKHLTVFQHASLQESSPWSATRLLLR